MVIYDSPSSNYRQGEQAKDVASALNIFLGLDKKNNTFSIIWPQNRKLGMAHSDAWSLILEPIKTVFLSCWYEHNNLRQHISVSTIALAHLSMTKKDLEEIFDGIKTQFYLNEVTEVDNVAMLGRPSQKHWAFAQWLSATGGRQ